MDVTCCDIGDEGCRILQTALMSCNVNSSQLDLRMSGNDTTDDCSSLIASLLTSQYPNVSLNLTLVVTSYLITLTYSSHYTIILL